MERRIAPRGWPNCAAGARHYFDRGVRSFASALDDSGEKMTDWDVDQLWTEGGRGRFYFAA